jgi:hypothetical protein
MPKGSPRDDLILILVCEHTYNLISLTLTYLDLGVRSPRAEGPGDCRRALLGVVGGLGVWAFLSLS